MEDKRKLELYEKALDWITENSTSRADLYDTLSEVLGMSDDEIIEAQFSTLTDFMDNEFDLQISAFVQSGGNCLVIPLPTNRYNLGTKLGSIGLGVNDPLLITDDSDAPVRVKLMTENSTGCHFIKLFDKNDNLMDVSNMIQRVMNSEEEIRPELRRRLVDGKYHNSEELLDDMAWLTSQIGEYTKTFYFPLMGTLDDGFGSADTVSNRYLRNFKSEIAELIEKEQSNDLNNMKDYFDEDENARQKMVSAKWGIEELNQTLYGKVDFKLRVPFTAEEQEKVRDWIVGQNSDGLGEGLEQREIPTEDGDLFVSMWNFGDDYFVYDEEEMATHFAGQNLGGMSQ